MGKLPRNALMKNIYIKKKNWVSSFFGKEFSKNSKNDHFLPKKTISGKLKGGFRRDSEKNWVEIKSSKVTKILKNFVQNLGRHRLKLRYIQGSPTKKGC